MGPAWKLYDVDVERASFSEILEWCLRRGADTMLLIVRIPSENKALAPARELFGSRVRDEFLAYGWPGTISLKKDNLVLELDFDPELVRTIMETRAQLARWRECNALPEDPCVFRAGDEWPMFYSITPEPTAWIVGDGLVRLAGVTPSLDRMTRRFIFSDRSFCKTEA